MSRTFCTVIDDPEADPVLSAYGAVMAKARHWSFKQIHVLHRRVADVKREAIRRFGITARQFNGVRFDLDQAVEAWKGGLKFEIARLEDSIAVTAARIGMLDRQMRSAKTERRKAALRFRQVGKKQRLDILKAKLKTAQAKLAVGKPRICFGGRDALRRGEIEAWRERRSTRILLVGSRTESFGNQSCQWNGNALSLRLPDAIGGKTVTLSGARFRYGQDVLETIMEGGRPSSPLTWLIFKDEQGRWHAHVTVNDPPAEAVSFVRNGVIAVDLNVDHLAVAVLDRYGNPLSRLTLGFPDARTDAGKAAAVIGDSVRALCLLALSRGYGIACEDLGFGKKKAGLREYGAAHARRLSGWSYAEFFTVLEARCRREGIELVKVNPAFTSVIARTKYARARSMSVHHAAALVIGRRAQGYAERFVSMDGAILDGPARNRPRAEWRRWRGVRRLPREAGAHVPVVTTAGSGVGPTPKGGASKAPASAREMLIQRTENQKRPHQARDAVALASDKVTTHPRR